MSIVFGVFAIILGLYGLLVLYYFYFFQFAFRNPKKIDLQEWGKPPITILLPIRNDAAKALRWLELIKFQLKEGDKIIILDDFSEEDESLEKLEQKVLSYEWARLIKLREGKKPQHGKKQAIEIGVVQAKNEWIVCTDADTVPPKDWLNALRKNMTENVEMLAGVHRYSNSENILNGLLSAEQDILSLISIATIQAGRPTMCNGANIAFRKSAFESVGGYKGLYHIAGGDDMLLYHRIWKKFPKRVNYITSSESIVSSPTPNSPQQLLKQRMRWLSKTGQYEVNWIEGQLLILFLGNCIAVVSLILSVFNPYLMIIYAIKVVFDFILNCAASRLNPARNYFKYLLYSFLYPFYAVWIGWHFLSRENEEKIQELI